MITLSRHRGNYKTFSEDFNLLKEYKKIKMSLMFKTKVYLTQHPVPEVVSKGC